MMQPCEHDVAAVLVDLLPRLVRHMKAGPVVLPDDPRDDLERQSIEELRGASGQVALLSILVAEERATMQDVATQMAVTPATITMMVKRLLAQGYVERSRDDGDWRLVWVSATEQGKRAFQLYHEDREALLAQKLGQLDPEEIASLQAALPALCRLAEID